MSCTETMRIGQEDEREGAAVGELANDTAVRSRRCLQAKAERVV
jgi:hypothetical protein